MSIIYIEHNYLPSPSTFAFVNELYKREVVINVLVEKNIHKHNCFFFSSAGWGALARADLVASKVLKDSFIASISSSVNSC